MWKSHAVVIQQDIPRDAAQSRNAKGKRGFASVRTRIRRKLGYPRECVAGFRGKPTAGRNGTANLGDRELSTPR
jgi:hypothetical protein